MLKNNSNIQIVRSPQEVRLMSIAIEVATEKLKNLLKKKNLKGIEGIGIIDRKENDSVIVVDILKRSFNKNAKLIPPSIDGFKIELRPTIKIKFDL